MELYGGIQLLLFENVIFVVEMDKINFAFVRDFLMVKNFISFWINMTKCKNGKERNPSNHRLF